MYGAHILNLVTIFEFPEPQSFPIKALAHGSFLADAFQWEYLCPSKADAVPPFVVISPIIALPELLVISLKCLIAWYRVPGLIWGLTWTSEASIQKY